MKGDIQLEKNVIWIIALAIFPICGVAGIAAKLRPGKKLTRVDLVGAMLNSGLFGVAIFCISAHYWGPDSLFLLIGLSVISGLGGDQIITIGIQAAIKLAKQWLKIDESP